MGCWSPVYPYVCLFCYRTRSFDVYRSVLFDSVGILPFRLKWIAPCFPRGEFGVLPGHVKYRLEQLRHRIPVSGSI
ncbi:hypothetical protein M404DRAFT_428092 [Pisolithus tinctorius Marx 270]|uniref:Uncharacterized protein n=1 Tax=Pisolithus tinctorius Marx 270 TaxID=870435 RepID=A0A0C3JDC5_PISTI|nr:hypothetical protein M404DRAFT_428092 [Pisolithus tinctorius Marx 270]